MLVTSGAAGGTVGPAVALFAAPAQFGLGTGVGQGKFPVAIATGDLSGDGIGDLVTANRDSGSVSLLVGDGSGRFLPAVNYSSGKGTSDVAVGDLDGDRRVDVAATNRNSKTVSLLFNKGGGVLQQPPTNITTGKGPSAVAIDDFNGDGTPDLAVANSNDNTVSRFIGQGGGQFAADSVTAVGADPESLAAADFDQNGMLDLAVANRGGSDLAILSGDGSGGFTVQSVTVGSTPTAVAAADLNGDGHPDLVAAIRVGTKGNANTVAVLPWNGGFATAQSYGKTSAHPTSLAVGDMNADGYPDVAVGSGDSAQASILWGKGQGLFEQKLTLIAAGRAPIGVTATDLNGDDQLDLAFADSFLDGVTVVLGGARTCGVGGMQQMPTSPVGSQPVAATVGDLDADGILDAVTANSFAASVTVLVGEGNGCFRALKPDLPVGNDPNDVALGDLNGDGILDIATANILSNTVSIWRGLGGQQFEPRPEVAVRSRPHALAIADLNGDDRADLVTANTGSDNVTVLINQGNGTFAASAFPAGSQPVSVAVADLTGDGRLDVAVADYASNKAAVLPGGGGDGLASYDVGNVPTAVTAGDVNGDGRADLVVTNRHSSSVSVLLADDSGGLRPAIDSPVEVGYKPVAVTIADLSLDGFPDLAVALSGGKQDTDYCHSRGGASGGLALLYGDGSGSFTPAGSYASLNDACDVAVGDLNGDGRLDVTVAAARTRVAESYLNETP